MDLHLLIHNIVSIMSGILLLGMAFFVFINGRRVVSNITFTLVILGGAVFSFSHVIGVNIDDPILSKNVLMFNLFHFPLGAVFIHAVLVYLGKDKEKRGIILLAYITAFFMTMFFIIFPELFLLPSVPKMYFPNYYVLGELNWTRLVFLNVIAVPYALYLLTQAYKVTTNLSLRNQHKYLIFFFASAFYTGFIANFLMYDIQIDPLLGMFFSFVCLGPFLYGAIKYELFNIKVIATQALLYSLSVVVVGLGLAILIYGGALVSEAYPSFPRWIVPLASSVLLVTAGFIIWWRLRENDILKYEFITTVTHKFRTPLTQIGWAASMLNTNTIEEENKEQIKNIQTANTKMTELINILANVSESEGTLSAYKMKKNNFSEIVTEVYASFKQQIDVKKINLFTDIHPNVSVMCDKQKMQFVLQVIIENAIKYTQEGGKVSVYLSNDQNYAHLDVVDSGMGISQDEIPRLFTKFYRTPSAQKADTEGMGVGLYILKDIVSRHGGTINVQSDGLGKGSTFTLMMKLA